MIHAYSTRTATFLPFNQRRLDMLDSQLFGHRKGPYGGERKLPGVIRAAAVAPCFDEIGDTTLEVQLKLLRFERGPSDGVVQLVKADVRIISAMNADSIPGRPGCHEIFHRLNIVRLHVAPSCAARRDSCAANHYSRSTRKYCKGDLRLAEETMNTWCCIGGRGCAAAANEMRRTAALAGRGPCLSVFAGYRRFATNDSI
jgi:DNA-binding NtrC family response regulator